MAMWAGVQKVSRPIVRCHEMSQRMPITMAVPPASTDWTGAETVAILGKMYSSAGETMEFGRSTDCFSATEYSSSQGGSVKRRGGRQLARLDGSSMSRRTGDSPPDQPGKARNPKAEDLKKAEIRNPNMKQ